MNRILNRNYDSSAGVLRFTSTHINKREREEAKEREGNQNEYSRQRRIPGSHCSQYNVQTALQSPFRPYSSSSPPNLIPIR